jgi:hypothetical protein
LDRRKVEVMSKRRKIQFKEALDAKREALASAAKQPKPEKQPEWEPESPELRAAVLTDRLEEREAEFAKEQERRRAAERKVQELSSPRRTLGELILANKRRRRAPWK